MRWKEALRSLVVLPSVIDASRYTLHHRLGTTSLWTPRAFITLDTDGGKPTYEDATGKSRPWEALADTNSDSSRIYQLALTSEGESNVGLTSPMTFTKACLLKGTPDESIIIHHSGRSSDTEAYGLSYDLLGIDTTTLTSSGCPSDRINPARTTKVNVQVVMPEAPLIPLAPRPPPVKADGTPLAEGEEPPKEKSFLAKNWYYFVPILLLMAIPTELADSAAEESEEGSGENPFQAGVQRAAGNGAVKVSGGSARRR